LQLFAVKSRLIQPGDSLLERLFESLSRARLRIENGDILAVASKVVSVAEKNILPLKTIEPTGLAKKLGGRFGLPPDFVQIVVDEADDVYGGVPSVILTIKNGDATANSGVDRKNAPPQTVIPWPLNPHQSAKNICAAVDRKLGKKIGVVIVDSRVTPLRLGTVGLAIACSGFQPVRDERGVKDLYGRKVSITFHALADGIAAAAQLLMGETREATPFVLVRDAPVRLANNDRPMSMTLPVEDCLYMSQIQPMSKTKTH
jgi:coenzyme F420-0:L-glutamate ligase